jgi:hypothetical protein
MDCPACGSVATINAAGFCTECWHKHPVSPSASATTAPKTIASKEYETCPACWKNNQTGQQFCKHCGTEMNAADPVAKQPEPKPVQPATQAAPPPEPTQQESERAAAQQDVPPASPISLAKPEPAKITTTVETKPPQPDSTPTPSQDAVPSQPVDAKKTILKIIGTVLRLHKAQHQFGILIMGVFLLLGVGAAYYLWQKYSAVLTEQEPVATREAVEPSAPTKPNSQQEPVPQNESGPQPLVAEATVEQPAKPDPMPAQSAAFQPESTHQGAQPSMEPRNTAVSKPAPVKESGLSQPSQSGTGGTQEKPSQNPPQKAESKPGTVEEIVAHECAREKGFKRIICEEKVRFKLCDGQWGVKLGCPKYEHDDPLKF